MAARSVSFGLVEALAGVVVTYPGFMALIQRGAGDRVGTGADTVTARVGLGAGVAIVATGAAPLGWIGALSGGGVADTDVVAGVECGADDRIATDADPTAARVTLGARVAVVARHAIVIAPTRRADGRVADLARVAGRRGAGTDKDTGDVAARCANTAVADQPAATLVVARATLVGCVAALDAALFSSFFVSSSPTSLQSFPGYFSQSNPSNFGLA